MFDLPLGAGGVSSRGPALLHLHVLCPDLGGDVTGPDREGHVPQPAVPWVGVCVYLGPGETALLLSQEASHSEPAVVSCRERACEVSSLDCHLCCPEERVSLGQDCTEPRSISAWAGLALGHVRLRFPGFKVMARVLVQLPVPFQFLNDRENAHSTRAGTESVCGGSPVPLRPCSCAINATIQTLLNLLP